jgi:hypothetical protein
MFTLPTFPSIDFSSLDASKIAADIRKIDIPGVDAEKLVAGLRDAAFVTIGVGVLAVQQADVRRRDLVTTITERFDATKVQVDGLVDKFEAIVSDNTTALFNQAREVTKAARQQVNGLRRAAA